MHTKTLWRHKLVGATCAVYCICSPSKSQPFHHGIVRQLCMSCVCFPQPCSGRWDLQPAELRAEFVQVPIAGTAGKAAVLGDAC